MSVQTEITRLQDARNLIRDKLIELGLAQSNAKIDALATAVDGIENKGAVSATVKEGETYAIPKGYHNGSGTVSGVAGGGSYNLQSKSVTPTKKQQSVTADQGYYGLSDVTVTAIPEAYQNVSGVTAGAADVKANKIIVDAKGNTIAGTMPDNGAVDTEIDTYGNPYTIPAGYHNGSGKVKVKTSSFSFTPDETGVTIIGANASFIVSGNIDPIPQTYIDGKNIRDTIISESSQPSDQASADMLLTGHFLWGGSDEKQTVSKVPGTMPNRGAVSATIDGLTTTSYTIAKGYHNGSGKVTLSNDIEQALAAI